jgi:hypothetical protein
MNSINVNRPFKFGTSAPIKQTGVADAERRLKTPQPTGVWQGFRDYNQ